ncbi:MAG: hypothetical protein PVJ67_00755 [Candidatus Pacearchaeota archaeon]|jgi:hypothetical protein
MKFIKKIFKLIKDKKAKVKLDEKIPRSINSDGTPSMKIARKYRRYTDNPNREINNPVDSMKFFHDVKYFPRKIKKMILGELDNEIVKEHYENK